MGVILSVPVSEDPAAVTTPERAEVGRRLKAARLRAGLKVKPAARKAGLSDQLWHQAEKGYKRVSAGLFTGATTLPENLVAMARAVDLDPDEILEPLGILMGFPEPAGGHVSDRVGGGTDHASGHVTRRRPPEAGEMVNVDDLTVEDLVALLAERMKAQPE